MFEKLQDVMQDKEKIPKALLLASINDGWSWKQNGFKNLPGDHPIKNVGGVWKAMDSKRGMKLVKVTDLYITGVDEAGKTVTVSTSSQAKFHEKVSAAPLAVAPPFNPPSHWPALEGLLHMATLWVFLLPFPYLDAY